MTPGTKLYLHPSMDTKDAQRWRYWRSLLDVNHVENHYDQDIAAAITPDELDAAVDAAICAQMVDNRGNAADN